MTPFIEIPASSGDDSMAAAAAVERERKGEERRMVVARSLEAMVDWFFDYVCRVGFRVRFSVEGVIEEERERERGRVNGSGNDRISGGEMWGNEWVTRGRIGASGQKRIEIRFSLIGVFFWHENFLNCLIFVKFYYKIMDIMIK